MIITSCSINTITFITRIPKHWLKHSLALFVCFEKGVKPHGRNLKNANPSWSTHWVHFHYWFALRSSFCEFASYNSGIVLGFFLLFTIVYLKLVKCINLLERVYTLLLFSTSIILIHCLIMLLSSSPHSSLSVIVLRHISRKLPSPYCCRFFK